jgi:hypothetical protein
VAARCSLVCFGILVDLLGVFLVLQALKRLSKSTSFFSMFGLGVLVAFCSNGLLVGTIYAYQLVS